MRQILSLVSFADSSLRHSAERLRKQAIKMGCFSKVTILDEKSLDFEFRESNKNILSKTLRGFGFWIWKPQVILQGLRECEEGDVLVYMDVGCHLNRKGISRLREYLDIVRQSESGILAFELERDGVPVHRECEWTKGDVFDYFGSSPQSSSSETAQIEATVVFIHKRESSVQFVLRWLEIMTNNPHLCNDSPSITPNHLKFIEHRHDQSVFSLLSKEIGISRLSYSENFPRRRTLLTRKPAWSELKNMPVHAKRDKERLLEHVSRDFVNGLKFLMLLRFLRRLSGQ